VTRVTRGGQKTDEVPATPVADDPLARSVPVLQLAYGGTMIERQTIDGRECTVAYITQDFQPADKDNWELAKIIFDDGEVVFVTNVEADIEADR